MKRMMKSRKAVSPVMAVILLIAIAVAASVTVFAYTQGIIGGVSSAQVQVTKPTLLTSLSDDDELLIRVQNTGGQSFTIGRIDLEQATADRNVGAVYDANTGELLDVNGDDATSMDLILGPGQSVSLEVHTFNDWNPGDTITVEIWEADGDLGGVADYEADFTL